MRVESVGEDDIANCDGELTGAATYADDDSRYA